MRDTLDFLRGETIETISKKCLTSGEELLWSSEMNVLERIRFFCLQRSSTVTLYSSIMPS